MGELAPKQEPQKTWQYSQIRYEKPWHTGDVCRTLKNDGWCSQHGVYVASAGSAIIGGRCIRHAKLLLFGGEEGRDEGSR